MKEKKTLKTIRIRKLSVKDLPQIIRIEEAITKVKTSQQKKAFLKDHIQKESSVSFVAQTEGQVVGFIISEILTNSFGLDQGGWIENFGIFPQYMGQGIGQTLARHLFESLPEKENIRNLYFSPLGFGRSAFLF